MSIKKISVLLVLTVFVMCFIFYNSFQNSEESNEASEVIEEIVEPIVEEIVGEDVVDVTYLVRKGAHITEFFVLGVLVCNVLNEISKKRKNFKYILGYGLFYVLAVAVTDEYIQSFSDRTSSVIDVLIDFSGASSGFAATVLWGLLSEKSKIKSKEGNNNGDQN